MHFSSEIKSEDFVFESVIGRGTFGTVHLVRRKVNLRPYVIKEQELNDRSFSNFLRMMQEMEIIQKLRHPNVISHYGAWHEGNRSYILMDFARHGTLKDLLEKRELPLKEEDALYLFTQVVLGVQHIHSKNILHRDLKPENIMLTGEKADVVKIVDFGLSKNLEEETTLSHAGTFFYMAPEVLRRESYNYKADIWSMGVVLYEMVTKRLPFPAETFEELIEMINDEEPKPLEEGLSKDVIGLISKMLRKKAPFRPSTDMLIVCPCLYTMKAKVYLNIGCITPLPNIDFLKDLGKFIAPAADEDKSE